MLLQLEGWRQPDGRNSRARAPAKGPRMKASEAFGRARLQASARRRKRSFDVGLLVPTSGAMGLLGPSAWACAQLARDDWNAIGGVEGREVRLHLLDAGEGSDVLDEQLRELLDEQRFDSLVMLSNTEVCRHAAGIVDERVPLVYTPLFEGVGLPAWVHAIGETPGMQLLPAIAWMTGRHRTRRWYLLGNDYSWPRCSHAAAIPFLRASGCEVVGERYVPLGARDFDAVIADIAAMRADVVLLSLLAGDAVHLCRDFERAGLDRKVLRLSTCVEENAVLGIGPRGGDGMFVAAGYFAALDNDANGSFKERYHARFGDRAPALNASSQSVYEGFVHLQRQASPAVCSSARAALRGVRYQRGADPHSARAPIYLGGVEGLDIRPLQQLSGAHV